MGLHTGLLLRKSNKRFYRVVYYCEWFLTVLTHEYEWMCLRRNTGNRTHVFGFGGGSGLKVPSLALPGVAIQGRLSSHDAFFFPVVVYRGR